jgi:PBP1b-binding outer membrane lipoprotein LpoB
MNDEKKINQTKNLSGREDALMTHSSSRSAYEINSNKDQQQFAHLLDLRLLL